jgi:hypothetical protein
LSDNKVRSANKWQVLRNREGITMNWLVSNTCYELRGDDGQSSDIGGGR